MSILIIYYIFLITVVCNGAADFVCDNSFDDEVCCKSECPFCGNCKKNFNANNSYLNYDLFFEDCCEESIMQNNITCNSTVLAPCILDDSYLNDIQRIIKFFKKGPVYLIVIVAIIMFLVAIFFLYACCVFGKKKPILDYKYIRNTLEDIK